MMSVTVTNKNSSNPPASRCRGCAERSEYSSHFVVLCSALSYSIYNLWMFPLHHGCLVSLHFFLESRKINLTVNLDMIRRRRPHPRVSSTMRSCETGVQYVVQSCRSKQYVRTYLRTHPPYVPQRFRVRCVVLSGSSGTLIAGGPTFFLLQ